MISVDRVRSAFLGSSSSSGTIRLLLTSSVKVIDVGIGSVSIVVVE